MRSVLAELMGSGRWRALWRHPRRCRGPQGPCRLHHTCKGTGHKDIRLKMQTTRGGGEGMGQDKFSFNPSQAYQRQDLAAI